MASLFEAFSILVFYGHQLPLWSYNEINIFWILWRWVSEFHSYHSGLLTDTYCVNSTVNHRRQVFPYFDFSTIFFSFRSKSELRNFVARRRTSWTSSSMTSKRYVVIIIKCVQSRNLKTKNKVLKHFKWFC